MKPINPPERTLLGPGPSMVHPRVLAALAMPTVGHLDPYFQTVMDDVKVLIRRNFGTENEFAIPISGTGSAGMEAALCNFIEPEDNVLVCMIGYFGERMFDMAGRYSDHVDRLAFAWGEPIDVEAYEKAVRAKAYKLVAFVHCETSTGVLQPHVKELVRLAHENGALVVLDTVASWPGVPVEIDEWDVDIVYSGSQKALSAPPGLAPLVVNARAMAVLRGRKSKVRNWYLDLTALDAYWHSGVRSYHHTAPVNLIYSLREALLLVEEEGLENVHARHLEVANRMWAGLEALGAGPLIPPAYRSPTLTTPKIPAGVDDMAVRKYLMQHYNVEISGGFGPLAGKVWRIGLMGYSARKQNVALLLSALKEALAQQ